MSEGLGATAPVSSSASNSVVPASITKGGPAPHAKKPESPAPKTQSTSSPKEEQQSQPSKRKVKVDGQELEVSEEELIANYQKAKASDKRFQEAAQKAKQAEQILQALESGDLKFIESKLGKQKAKALFEDYLIQDMEYQNLSPAEKRALELEQENKSLKEAQEAEKKRMEEAQFSQEMERAHAEIDNEVNQALSELGMKPTPRLAVRIVDEMIARLSTDKQAIPAKQAAAKAVKVFQSEIQEYLPTLTIEQLRQVIPPQVIDQLRQSEVDKVLGDRQNRRVKTTQQRSEPKPQKPVGIDEYFKNLEQKINKKK